MIGNGIKSSSMREEDIYKNKREKPVLALLPESYSRLNAILVGARSTLLGYLILLANYLTTNYCSKKVVNNFFLRRMFYSK